MPKKQVKNTINFHYFWWLLLPCLAGMGSYFYGTHVNIEVVVFTAVPLLVASMVWNSKAPVRNEQGDNDPKLKMMGLSVELLKVIYSYLTHKESLALTSVEYGLRSPELLSYALTGVERPRAKVMMIADLGNSLLVSTDFGLWFRLDQGFDVEQITTFPLASNLKIHPKQVLFEEYMLFILDDQGCVYSGILGDCVSTDWLRQWSHTDKVSKMMGRINPKRDYGKMEIVPLPKAQKIAVSIELEVVVALTNQGLYLWGPDSHRILNLPNNRQNNPTKISIPDDVFYNFLEIVDFALSNTHFIVLTEDVLCSYSFINRKSHQSYTRNGTLLGMHLNPLLLYTFLVRKDSVVAYDSGGQSSLLAVDDPALDLPKVTHLDTDILESSFSELYTTDAKVVFRTSNAVYTCWYNGHNGLNSIQIQTLFEIEARKEELPPIRQMQAAYDAVYFLCEGGTVHQYHYATEGMKKVEFPEPVLSLRPRAYGRRYNHSFERGRVDSYQVVACTERSLYGICYPDDQGRVKTVDVTMIRENILSFLKKKHAENNSLFGFGLFPKVSTNSMLGPAIKMFEDEKSNSETKQPG